MNVLTTAGNILQRAVEFDSKQRYTEALICYQEGIQVLVDALKGIFSKACNSLILLFLIYRADWRETYLFTFKS